MIDYHLAITMTTVLKNAMIGSSWLAAAASDWTGQVTQNDFGRHASTATSSVSSSCGYRTMYSL